MEIHDFSDLTQFVYDEYLKITENFGVQNPSIEMIDFTEKTLKKYVKLYDKPLFRAAKRELKIQEAIDTMPHGKLWKFFHFDLWKQCEARLKEQEKFSKNENHNSSEPQSISVPAEIIKKTDLPRISEIE